MKKEGSNMQESQIKKDIINIIKKHENGPSDFNSIIIKEKDMQKVTKDIGEYLQKANDANKKVITYSEHLKYGKDTFAEGYSTFGICFDWEAQNCFDFSFDYLVNDYLLEGDSQEFTKRINNIYLYASNQKGNKNNEI